MVRMATLDPTFDRRTGIGASEVAALLGLDPRKSPLSLWLDKTGNAEPFEGNRFTEMGQRFEPLIADAYAEREGVELETCTTVRHPEIPHVFATPDRRVVGTNRLVECKAVFSPRIMVLFGEDGTSDYPEHFAVQAMVQAAVADAEDVHLAALLGADLRVYRVPRDRDRERRLLDVVDAWWQRHIVGGERPALDGSEAAAEYLRRLFPKNQAAMLEADGPAADMVREVVALHAAQKAAENAFEVAKQNLCAVIADADGIALPGVGKATWKRANGSLKTDWEAVARELGAPDDVVIKHSKSVPGSRRFLVTAENSL